MSINNVVISGNLTRDAELRTTPTGLRVLGFGVAVNDYRLNRENGIWEEYPNYVDCTLFGNRAAAIHGYLLKGTKVCVKGRLRWRSWEKEGTRRSKLEVVADELEFLSARRVNTEAPDNQSPPREGSSSAPDVPQDGSSAVPDALPEESTTVYGQPPSSGVYDEEIPF